eukprot:4082673-Prymnesium_polylepis.1
MPFGVDVRSWRQRHASDDKRLPSLMQQRQGRRPSPNVFKNPPPLVRAACRPGITSVLQNLLAARHHPACPMRARD